MAFVSNHLAALYSGDRKRISKAISSDHDFEANENRLKAIALSAEVYRSCLNFVDQLIEMTQTDPVRNELGMKASQFKAFNENIFKTYSSASDLNLDKALFKEKVKQLLSKTNCFKSLNTDLCFDSLDKVSSSNSESFVEFLKSYSA